MKQAQLLPDPGECAHPKEAEANVASNDVEVVATQCQRCLKLTWPPRERKCSRCREPGHTANTCGLAQAQKAVGP